MWGVALSHPPLTLPLTHANKGHVTRLMLSSLEFHFPAGLTSPVKLNGGGKFSLLVLRLFVPEELVPYFNRVVLEATCASQSTPWQGEFFLGALTTATKMSCGPERQDGPAARDVVRG